MQSQPNDVGSRIAEFLPKLRLGLDIGEWAGGIAVVRGCEILHAETYTDYHQTTLEDRRRLRRGRRTRRAKKARLARLRSWVLRQALPDGSGLPDPYKLMRRKEFQCQPGEYRVGLKKLAWATGKKKQELPTWVEAVKSGARTDAAAFVVALTHIFQKRGFKWSGSDLREMTDDELAEELNGVRLTKTVAEQVQAEIDRRRKQPEPDFEGKIEDLAGRIGRALGRPKQPRVAEHRSIVEDDLRAVVETFTGRHCPNKPMVQGSSAHLEQANQARPL